MMNHVIVAVLLLILILLHSNSSNAGPPIVNSIGYKGLATPEQVAETPRANEEAELVAIKASGAFIAPQEVYDRVDRELKIIRSKYPDVLSITVRRSVIPQELIVGFDDTGKSEIEHNTYDAWNDANAFYGVTHNKYSVMGGSALLKFQGRFNMPLLASEYAKLEHVKYASPNGSFGDGNDVCLQISGSSHFYVFYAGSGDCLSGCTSRTYWGFSVDNSGGVSVLGTWRPSESDASLPKWFQELSLCRSWLQH